MIALRQIMPLCSPRMRWCLGDWTGSCTKVSLHSSCFRIWLPTGRRFVGHAEATRQSVQLWDRQGVPPSWAEPGQARLAWCRSDLHPLGVIRCTASPPFLCGQVLVVWINGRSRSGLVSWAGASVRGGFIVTSRRRIEVPENGPDVRIIYMVR